MQKTLVYGTTNPAKLHIMREILSAIPLKIVGLEAYKRLLPTVDESGRSPLENARIKALAYYGAIGQPVFSCDSGLFLEGVPDEEQPGVHVRTVGGKYLRDEEMTAHYSSLAAKHGGRLRAIYKNGICLVVNEQEIYEYMGDDIDGAAFYIVAQPHKRRVKGFPLDCLSVELATGLYYYDLKDEPAATMKDGFAHFFERVMQQSKALLPED